MTDDIKEEILQELRLLGIENKRTLNSVQAKGFRIITSKFYER
jgi:hypothetical protein